MVGDRSLGELLHRQHTNRRWLAIARWGELLQDITQIVVGARPSGRLVIPNPDRDLELTAHP